MHKSIKMAVVVSTLSVSACGAGDPSEQTGKVEEAIINGTPVSVDNLGTPLLLGPGPTPGLLSLCSSTMLSERWLLTAHHCVTVGNVPSGGTAFDPNTVTANILNGPSATAVQIFLHPLVDVALVELGSSLIGPSGVSYANPLYWGSASGLVPGPLYCQGWGRNTPTSGEGVLRSATMTVSSADGNFMHLPPNNVGQVQFKGDSGSSCFFTVDGVPRVVGVASTGDLTVANLVSNEAFRDWAEGIMGNAATVFRDGNFSGGSAQALVPGGPNGGRYNTGQLTVGNDSISSFVIGNAGFLTLFSDGNFANSMGNFFFSTALVPPTVNDKTSSVIVTGGGVMLRNSGVVQASPYAGAGRYTFNPALPRPTSISVPAGWRVTLYQNPDFTGISGRFEEGTYFTLGAINNIASSMIVEEPVVVYVDSNYNGAYGKLLPGCYDVNAMGVPNDSISSIFVPPGMGITVYNPAHFGTPSATYTTSQPSLPTFNDAISSVCVFRN